MAPVIARQVGRGLFWQLDDNRRPQQYTRRRLRVGQAQHVIDRLWVEAAYPARLRAYVEPQLAADTPAILSSIVNLEFHAVGDTSELMRSQSGAGLPSATTWIGLPRAVSMTDHCEVEPDVGDR
jgi:hypothetical protein